MTSDINDSLGIVVASNVGSSLLHWLNIVNPLLSFFCMLISAIGGIYYVLLKRKEYKSK